MADVSGLVSGVSMGVVKGVAIDVGVGLLEERLLESVPSARSCDKLSRSAVSSCWVVSSLLSCSIPRKSGGLVLRRGAPPC